MLHNLFALICGRRAAFGVAVEAFCYHTSAVAWRPARLLWFRRRGTNMASLPMQIGVSICLRQLTICYSILDVGPFSHPSSWIAVCCLSPNT